MEVTRTICVFCEWAEMQEDPVKLCGILCSIGKSNKDGECKFFKEYISEAERGGNLAFKTNVVKKNWQVRAREIGGFKQKVYLVLAESKEKAKLSVPDRYEVLDVRCLDAEGGDTDG